MIPDDKTLNKAIMGIAMLVALAVGWYFLELR